MLRARLKSVLIAVCPLPFLIGGSPTQTPTSAAAEVNDARWLAIGRSGLFRERPRQVTVENFRYYAVEFGPEAQWIMEHQEDEYLKRLLARLPDTRRTQPALDAPTVVLITAVTQRSQSCPDLNTKIQLQHTMQS